MSRARQKGRAIALGCVLAVLLVVAACQADASMQTRDSDWRDVARDSVTLFYKAPDQALAPTWARYAARGIQQNQAFFGVQFKRAPAVRVYAQRDSFLDRLNALYPVALFECWMIGTATADEITLLSPRVWETQACGNTSDSANVDRVIKHELVHVLHRQQASTQQLGALQWLLEGAAVLAAGQYDSGARQITLQQLRGGFQLTQLETAWSSPNGYGLSGSLVDYIDRTRGRAFLAGLFSLGSEGAVLNALQLSEQEFLQRWRADVLGGNQ